MTLVHYFINGYNFSALFLIDMTLVHYFINRYDFGTLFY